MIIYMDEYRKAKDVDVTQHDRYDEELLCVNWNPTVRMLAMSSKPTTREVSPQLPEDFSNIDAKAFLDRVYALAVQV